MQRRAILKGLIGGAMVSVAPKVSANVPQIILPEEKELIVDVVEIEQVIERQPPFHVTGWETETAQNLTLNENCMPVQGRLYEYLTINFELHGKEELERYEKEIYKGNFIWDLPVRNYARAEWEYKTVKGSIIESNLSQTVMDLLSGTIKAVVFYY